MNTTAGLVEKVARAIEDSVWLQQGSTIDFQLAARAAIEATRTPEASDTFKMVVEALKGFPPKNLCLTNRNIPDDTIVPLECTMGELRKIAAALAKAGAA